MDIKIWSCCEFCFCDEVYRGTQVYPRKSESFKVFLARWQKVALSRALMREKADLLILDEPTADAWNTRVSPVRLFL